MNPQKPNLSIESMAEITIRDLQLTFDGETLVISSLDNPNRSVAMDAESVVDLVEFVTSFAQTGANRRMTFRVPVLAESKFDVRVVVRGKDFRATPVDISMTGIFLDFPRQHWVDLPPDSMLGIKMRLGDHLQELYGNVRRCEGLGYGISFPDSITDESVEPPIDLRRIVMELQRQWTAKQRDLVRI